MTVDEMYQIITQQKPPVLYVSGKTSTGKTTFGRKLHDNLGYQIVELETVLLEIVKEHGFDEQSTFRKVLYEPGEFEEKSLFFEATDRIISNTLSQKHPVVIEGAVANVATLQRILRPAKDYRSYTFTPATSIFIPVISPIGLCNQARALMVACHLNSGSLLMKMILKSFAKHANLAKVLKTR